MPVTCTILLELLPYFVILLCYFLFNKYIFITVLRKQRMILWWVEIFTINEQLQSIVPDFQRDNKKKCNSWNWNVRTQIFISFRDCFSNFLILINFVLMCSLVNGRWKTHGICPLVASVVCQGSHVGLLKWMSEEGIWLWPCGPSEGWWLLIDAQTAFEWKTLVWIHILMYAYNILRVISCPAIFALNIFRMCVMLHRSRPIGPKGMYDYAICNMII